MGVLLADGDVLHRPQIRMNDLADVVKRVDTGLGLLEQHLNRPASGDRQGAAVFAELKSAIAAERAHRGRREEHANDALRDSSRQIRACRDAAAAQERKIELAAYTADEIKSMASVSHKGLKAFVSEELDSAAGSKRTLQGLLSGYSHTEFVDSLRAHCPLLVRLSPTTVTAFGCGGMLSREGASVRLAPSLGTLTRAVRVRWVFWMRRSSWSRVAER